MPAFNNRFEPASFGGIPLQTVIGGFGAIFFGVLAYMIDIDFLIQILFIIATVISAAIAITYGWLGDDRPFIGAIYNSLFEKNMITRDAPLDN